MTSPVSFVTLVGLDEHVLPGAWRGDKPDDDRRVTPVCESFCQFSVATREPLVIIDTHSDPLVQNMASVQRYRARISELGL